MSETRNTRNASRSSIEISEEILQRIRNGQYLPGDALSQYELAAEFETSRTPIREALRFLEARRAITLTSTGRAVVTVPSVRAIRESFQIRAELEGLAAQLAVDWIDDKDLELLAQHQQRYAEALRTRVRSEGGSDWLKFNALFHNLITQASHNERLHELVAELQGSIVSNVLGFASKMPPRLMEENIRQHEDIIAALTARNGAAAREAMATHLAHHRAGGGMDGSAALGSRFQTRLQTCIQRLASGATRLPALPDANGAPACASGWRYGRIISPHTAATTPSPAR